MDFNQILEKLNEEYVDTIKALEWDDSSEVFKNPSSKEIRDIIIDNKIRASILENGDVYCFSVNLSHLDLVQRLKLKNTIDIIIEFYTSNYNLNASIEIYLTESHHGKYDERIDNIISNNKYLNRFNIIDIVW